MHRWTPLAVDLDTLSALLFNDEHLVLAQDGVAFYNGKDRSPPHQSGRLALTSHRLIYVAAARPHQHSVALDLALVRQTEYWGGFLVKSSPKITLTFDADADAGAGGGVGGSAASAGAATPSGEAAGGAALPASTSTSSQEQDLQRLASAAASRAWVCRVCGMRNVPSAASLSKGGGALACELCGVPCDVPSSSSSSSSTPSSRLSTPPPRPPLPASVATSQREEQIDAHEAGARLACPVCTFLNHHSMAACEVCGSALFPPSTSSSVSLSQPSSSHAPPRSSSALPASTTSTPTSSLAPTPRPSTPAGDAKPTYVRLSFRKGGAATFYAALKGVLGEKAWDYSAPPRAGGGKKGARVGGRDGKKEVGEGEESTGGVGIDAILRGIDLSARDREDSMDVALKDLESLMAKAKEMITLAQSITSQLSSTSSSDPSSSDPASLALTSLRSLGLHPSLPSSSSLSSSLPAAVIASDARSEEEFHRALAVELAGLMHRTEFVENKGGIVGLDEVWCVWNRARGVALVPPQDLRLSAALLSSLPRPSSSSPPATQLSLRTFPSTSLSVLHTPRFSPTAFSARVLEALDLRQALVASLSDADLFLGSSEVEATATAARAEREGLTLLDLARLESIPVGLAKELLALMELGAPAVPREGQRAVKGGEVVRDEQGGGGEGEVRWFRNFIAPGGGGGGGWDGQVF
ncbi:hypothetical protein JCM8097_000223 [Rhodosporidiobolus ruineniae]